jgi:hypothetical protein
MSSSNGSHNVYALHYEPSDELTNPTMEAMEKEGRLGGYTAAGIKESLGGRNPTLQEAIKFILDGQDQTSV